METTAHMQYASALVAAIGELSNVPKTAKNPYFKSSYAPLDAIVEASRPILLKHGLAISQTPVFEDGLAGVTTTIIHVGGYSTSSTLLLPLKDQSSQGVGGCITYARRYSLAAVLGLATEEDLDGNDSSGLLKKEDRPAIAKSIDRNPTTSASTSASTVWKGVLPSITKIAAQSKEGSAKKWTLYGVEFNDGGKTIEALTFDKNLYDLATKCGKEGIVVDAGVAPNCKDPSKWELVSITPNEA